MTMDSATDTDVEIMELGFNLGHYETSLSVAAGMLARGSSAAYTPQTVRLADDQASKLENSIRRCSLPARTVYTATGLASTKAIVDFISGDFKQFVINIISDVVARWGSRREAIFVFAFHLARVVGAKQLGIPRDVHRDKMHELGRRFGLTVRTVNGWLSSPTISTLDKMREQLRQQTSVRSLTIALACVVSFITIGILGALVYLVPLESVINHPNSYGIQATVSLLVVCAVFGLFVPKWRKWLFGVAGLAFLGVLLQILGGPLSR